jgi:hypothetical protein
MLFVCALLDHSSPWFSSHPPSIIINMGVVVILQVHDLIIGMNPAHRSVVDSPIVLWFKGILNNENPGTKNSILK